MIRKTDFGHTVVKYSYGQFSVIKHVFVPLVTQLILSEDFELTVFRARLI